MTEHDDLRRALEELSSHPPVRDRKPAVHQRIAVARRRHNMIAGASLTVVALIAAIMLTALPTGGGGTADNAFISASPSALPRPAPQPTPSPEPPSVAAVSESAASVAARSVSAAATSHRGLPKNASPASKSTAATKSNSAAIANPPISTVFVTVPPRSTPAKTSAPALSAKVSAPPSTTGSSGATAASSTSPSGSATSAASSPPAEVEALTAEVQATTVNDGAAAPETTVVVRLRGSLHGSIERVDVWFTTLNNPAYADSATRTCTVADGPLRPIDETYTFRTRYRAAGQQQIDVNVTTLDANCAREEAKQRQWLLTGTVDIAAGSTLSNGVRPVSLFLDAPQVQDSKITLSARATDSDGFVSGFVVDWGSGNSQPFPGGDSANCAATENSGVFWPSGSGSGTFTSPVLPAGNYTVKVTVTSAGCDGKDEQTTQQTVTVTIP